MKCTEVQNIVNDSDTTRAYGIEVREHLQVCRVCRQHEEDLTRLRAVLLAPERVSVPWDFDSRLRERLASRSHRTPWWQIVPIRTLAYAASVVMIAAVAAGIFLSRQGDRRPPLGGAPVIATNSSGHAVSPGSTNEGARDITQPAEVQNNSSAAFSTNTGRKLKPQRRRSEPDAKVADPYFFLVRDPSNGERILTVNPVVFGSVPILGANTLRTQAARYEGTVF